MGATFYIVLTLIACCLKEGHGAATFIDLPTGDVVANFEGEVNATTLTCNAFNDEGSQRTTSWSVANFEGVTSIRRLTAQDTLFSFGGDLIPNTTFSYLNQITIVNWTSALDGVILYCGLGSDLDQASVLLKLYRPPNLRDNFIVMLQEKAEINVPVDLRQDPPAFPEPTVPTWMRNGQAPLRSGLTTTYSNVTFDSVMRNDAGNYTVTATNFLLNDSSRPIGSDSGSFYLDVLYPPSFVTEGPSQRYVLLNDSLSLLCGTGLDSNPPATITWTDPDGTPVMDNDRYDLENGPEVVRLDFTHTIPSDTGVWVCEAQTVSDKYIVSNGQLIRQDNVVIGTATVNIKLTVIIPPGQPTQLSVDSIGATWAHICWTAPSGDSMISRYEILAREVDGSGLVNVTTDNNSTLFNVTGLLPATNYSLSVVAVSEGGDIVVRGDESGSQVATTDVTVPELICSVSESQDTGDIIVTWSFVHTGGQPLTALSTNYNFTKGSTVVVGGVIVDNLNSTTTNVSDLVVGFTYTFTVTARNYNGSATASCGSVLHSVGVPASPEFGTPQSGPDAGEVTLRISTSSSGVRSSDHRFAFVITPVLGETRQRSMQFDRPDYRSGDVETIRVPGLERGSVYTFSATAMNIFGVSEVANSPPVTAAGEAITDPSPPSSPASGSNNSAAVVGGAVGGILVVVIIIAVLVVVVVALLLFRGRGGDYRPNKKEAVRYEPAPTSEGNVKVEEVSVDIGEDMEKGNARENELQYAELETFRPPSRQKNGTETKPIESEEPVEYATIASFKKVEDTPSAVPEPTPTSPTSVTDSADKAGTSTTVV